MVQHFASHKVKITFDFMPQQCVWLCICVHVCLSLSLCVCLLLYLWSWHLYGEESLYVLRHLETAAVLRDMIKLILL